MANKLSEDSLMWAIWQQQIKNTAKGVLSNFVGNQVALRRSTQDWHLAASIHMVAERHLITDKIGKQQLRKRLVDLIERGVLRDAVSPYCVFFLDTFQALYVYQLAIAWWTKRGLSETPQPKPETLDEMIEECQQYLLDNNKQIIWGQVPNYGVNYDG